MAQSGALTVQIGSAPAAPLALVNRREAWFYHKGNTPPQAGWRTNSDAALDGTWTLSPGGFGYSDDWAPETNNCWTILPDMRTGYTTLYIRKTFEVTNAIDVTRRLLLTMDWDDGFVAYLDGVELVRSNVVGAAGSEPLNTAAASASHECSTGNPDNSPQPAVTYDLGAIGSRLSPGPHVLAIIGLNRPNGSSDFVLVSDLAVSGVAAGGPINNGLYVLTRSNSLTLIGSNTIAGATRLSVNGDDAAFNFANGTWSKTQTFVPGFNRLYIAAHDAVGNILTNLIQDVVYEVTPVTVGGTLPGNTFWTNRNEVIHVTNNVVVPEGATLEIGLDAVVILSPGVSITATTNSSITSIGSELTRAYFLPASSNAWGGLTASGTNSSLTIRNADVVSGQVRVLNGGTLLLEDMTVRDLPDLSREVIQAVNGASLTMRRVYMSRFAEADSQNTPVLMEDCLLEGFLADGMDIKATNAPLIVRRTTLRNADPNNSNADGIDFGPGPGTVENCLIYNFPDKGVSIGGASGTVIRDSLIYKCGIGISAYSSSNCIFVNTTIAACSNGVFLRNNPGPAFAFATNLIIWGNTNNIIVTNTSALEISYSDIQGTNFPGTGNISADPLFVNAAAGNYSLRFDSPAVGAGLGGVDMGTRFPVGGIPSQPARLAAITPATNAIMIIWRDTADNEEAVIVQRSIDRVNWQTLGRTDPGETQFQDDTAILNQPYYYRVRATNASGVSPFSNLARAALRTPATIAGGTLTENTIWSGLVLVYANVIVPTNISLTVLPGTIVQLTNAVSIRAVAGGVIDIQGTRELNVILQPMVAGSLWGELSVQGTNASITMRHADISGGQTTVYTNAIGVFEDSFFHDYRLSGGTIFTSPILLTQFAGPTTVSRCHFREYHETLFRNGVIVIEDSLFENIHGDGLDFDGALPGTVLRRSTFRHGNSGNIDAVDVGNDGTRVSIGVLVESCLMFDFPFDKGVSIGDGVLGTVVTNCLVYSCNSGVAVKDACPATIYNCTLVNNTFGINLQAKFPLQFEGGRATNTCNNILWGNAISIQETNNSRVVVNYSDLQGTNFPGTGNISADPLFLNAAARDYRLATNSPARGSGLNGADMGAHFPVGSMMAPSHPSFQLMAVTNGMALLRFWADSERTYTVECSDVVSGGAWTRIANIPTAARPRLLTVTNLLAPDNRFYRLVTPQRP